MLCFHILVVMKVELVSSLIKSRVCSVDKRTPVGDMSLHVTLLNELSATLVAEVGAITAMHAHMGFHAEKFGVSLRARDALQNLVWPVRLHIAFDDLPVACLDGIIFVLYDFTVLIPVSGEDVLNLFLRHGWLDRCWNGCAKSIG